MRRAGREAPLEDGTAGGQAAQRVAIGAAVLLALLTVGSTVLNTLPLRVHILGLALALLAVVTVLVNGGLSSRAAKVATRRQAEELRGLLSSWPLRTPGDLGAYALGVRSTSASVAPRERTPTYVPRDIDRDVDQALEGASIVLLVGPPCAGKSRTAVEALMRSERTKDAGMIVPDDAQALTRLLANPDWVIDPGEHYVLWLDDLERFLEPLQLRRLDAFIRSPEPRRQAARDVTGCIVVATLREDVFLSILNEGGDRAHTLRGFVARAERIVVDAELSEDERERLAEAYPHAPHGPSFAAVFGDTMVQLGHPLYTPPMPSAAPRSGRPLPSPVAAALVTLGLVGGLAVAGFTGGWVNPPPLAERFRSLEARDDPCGGAGLSPTAVAAVRTDVVRVVHRGEGCPESDVIEVYPRDGSTLAPDSGLALQAAAEPKEFFRCLGPEAGDPCHADIVQNKRVIVGALVDAASRQRVPIAIYRDGNRYVPEAIDLAVPSGMARASATSPALAQPNRTITVIDRRSRRKWTLEGTSVLAAVMVPPVGDHGATLVAAYAAGRKLSRPELVVRGYELRLNGNRVDVGGICDGKTRGALRFTVGDTADLEGAIRRRYVRASTTGRVACNDA